MSKHHGKTFFITGGSRGIGSGIATKLAQQGARVIISYANRSDAADKVISSCAGEGHFAVQMDISSEQSIQQAFDFILEKCSSLDGLVNNAGITKDQLLLRMKASDFDEVIQTNLRGTFLCIKMAVKSMIKARRGSIVNITSVIGQTGNAGQSNYAASKAGIEAFTKSVAKEVASRGVRLNCVAPGFIQTEMTEILDDKQKQFIMSQIPMNNMGSSENIADAVSFLLSAESDYITGQTLSVNGGMWM